MNHFLIYFIIKITSSPVVENMLAFKLNQLIKLYFCCFVNTSKFFLSKLDPPHCIFQIEHKKHISCPNASILLTLDTIDIFCSFFIKISARKQFEFQSYPKSTKWTHSNKKYAFLTTLVINISESAPICTRECICVFMR